MQATLNLVDHVLAMGRRFQEIGRQRDALTLLTRLSDFRHLPADAAEETQARLAELHLKRRRFRRARRHLTAALRHQPDNARYHYLMATALQMDDEGNLERAADHYRRALELDPGHVKCLADFGLLLVRQGQAEEGVARLREAVEKAPDDAEVLGKLVKGLRLAGRSDEARQAVRLALFRHPHAPRFRQLWNEYQFHHARQQCEAARLKRAGADEEAVLLPFVRVVQDTPTGGGTPTILRHEEARPGRGVRRGEQRNVQ
jgi:Tfp pilus assembly protein PilF